MNIKDFLLDNYIYILIVIILIIITIIGFLADKKRGKTKGKKQESADVPTTNTNIPNNNGQVGQMNYQPMGDNINNMAANQTNGTPVAMDNGLNETPMTNMNQTTTQTVPAQELNFNNVNENANMPGTIPTPYAQNNNVNMPTSPQPVEPISTSMNVIPEPMSAPLSEQRPVIQPATPVIETVNPVPVAPIPSAPTPVSVENNINAVPNNVGQVPNFGTNNEGNMAPGNPNMIPNPSIPSPSPTPIPQNPNQTVEPTPMPMTPGATVPNSATTPGPVPQQPVGFVFGPQQSNQNNNGMQ